ncbi:DUF5999 family protein [Streptomyces galbus]|uniref:Uncharacterized protein n=1 Tax=Streptomyces galbus TaxID=33898 RepID=A0A4U5X7T1_STRGB|nr:DUF5999 family protein [Streptomyces galbus]TKT10692.1 hypothetical protein E4U92_07185 [Streptomyces galbus]GHD21242.1 hypothetical protein GCM10010335_01020 [Streptomyces galbus]
MCSHPTPTQTTGRPADSRAAHVVAAHPEQGWDLLCDGTIVFDDSGALLPDGRVLAPHRLPVDALAAAA